MAANFVAYPSQPADIGSTITATLKLIKTERPGLSFKGWAENDIAGRFIVDPILDEIEACNFFVADVTRLNFNVTYETGYALGRNRRAFLVRNKAFTSDDALTREVGIYDTLGYKTYSTSRELLTLLTDVTDVTPLVPSESEVNPKSPVYVILPKVKTDNEIQLVSRVRKAFRSNYRTFDPDEQGRLSAVEAIRNVCLSHGIIVPLISAQRTDAQVHNLRAAFVAGLAAGMDKELLLLQFGEDPVPLDYRDFVKYVATERQLEGYFGDFAPEVFSRFQSDVGRAKAAPTNRLQQLTIGASSAENEMGHLADYYLETEEF